MSIAYDQLFWEQWLKLYRSLPAVWRLKSPEYFNRKAKEAAYQKLVCKLRERYPRADRNMVVKKINNFRTHYRKTRRKILDGTLDETKNTLWYYSFFLEFLENQDAPVPPYEETNSSIYEEMKPIKYEEILPTTYEETIQTTGIANEEIEPKKSTLYEETFPTTYEEILPTAYEELLPTSFEETVQTTGVVKVEMVPEDRNGTSDEEILPEDRNSTSYEEIISTSLEETVQTTGIVNRNKCMKRADHRKECKRSHRKKRKMTEDEPMIKIPWEEISVENSKKSPEDLLAKVWATELKEMDPIKRKMAIKIISDVIFYGSIGKLEPSHVFKIQNIINR